jgi:hypothetical protein
MLTFTAICVPCVVMYRIAVLPGLRTIGRTNNVRIGRSGKGRPSLQRGLISSAMGP